MPSRLNKFAILFLFSQTVVASPVFYKCDTKGNLSEFLSSSEVLIGLQKMQVALGGDRKDLFNKLCAGKAECEKKLHQVLELNHISQKSASDELARQLAALRSGSEQTPILKVSTEIFDLEKSIRDTAFEISACRQTEVKLEPDRWVREGCVSFYYPHKNEYTYATGYKLKEGKAKSLGCASADQLSKYIRKALIMGVDPVVYLSIGLMEEGFNGYSYLYLDPIGVMRSIGCPEVKTDITKNSSNKLGSYGNYHLIKPAVIKNSDLSNRLKTYLEDVGQKVTKGAQYYCASLTEEDGLQLKSKPDPSECCLEIGFKGGKLENIKEAMVQHYISKVIQAAPYGSSDPAFRIQGFNGFSKLMGGAESVPVFRSGVDYTKNPAYGYQAMDFIINDLQSNPWIAREIEKQKNSLKLSSPPPSILCRDLQAGIYYIDSDHYFNLHRNSKRMSSIENLAYNSMTERQKKVIGEEVDYLISKGTYPDKIYGKKVPNPFTIQANVKSSSGKAGKILFSPELGFNSQDSLTQLLPKDKISKGYNYVSDGLKYKIKPVGSNELEFPVQDYLISGLPPGGSGITPFTVYYPDGSKMEVDPTTTVCYGPNKKQTDCVGFGYLTDHKVVSSNGHGYELKFDELSDEYLEKMMGNDLISHFSSKVSFGGNEWISLEVSDIPKKTKKTSEATKSELVKYYFEKLHKDRDTIEKASEYFPWRDLTNEEVMRMGNTPPEHLK